MDTPSYGNLDPQQCYQPDLSAVRALNEGGRLDVLALSAYPDGVLMSVPKRASCRGNSPSDFQRPRGV
ncbi:MAG: hypothetical protein BRD55_04515 [Bacteroidetes bacterium SW_9_63_38]|nr:MAG: hypothetical protein BRD55_04515 [Bacteroidetes bacterium SW_9_63_38]